MGSFFGAIVQWLLSRLFKQTPPLSQEATQAERAGVAETKLQSVEIGHEAAAAAVAAVRRVDDQLVREPASLRAPDPYSRD